jgi:hypothetical protein
MNTDEQLIDDRLALLARAAARHLLFEIGELNLEEASEGLIDDMTFCSACETNARARKAKAPTMPRAATVSTMEALAYSCRQGPQALERPHNRHRLAQLSEEQLRELHARVQRFREDLEYESRPAVRWTTEQADLLVEHWGTHP